MLNITKGQVLVNKLSGREYEVIQALEGASFIKRKEGDEAAWYIDEQMEKYFNIPKVKWTPSEGERYYYVGPVLQAHTATRSEYNSVDEALISIRNCFQTKEECEKACAAFKEMLGKINGGE